MTVAVTVVTVASAAQLSVRSDDPLTQTKGPCTTATLSTTATGTSIGGTYNQVQVSDIPATCYNLDVLLSVVGTGETQLAEGTGATGATGTATITTTAYFNASAAQSVALIIDIWGISATWTPPTVTPTISCIALNNGRNPWKNHTCTVTNISVSGMYPNSIPPGGQMMNFTFNVTTDGAHWRATIDFTAAGFPWVPVWAGQYSNQVQLMYSGCSSPMNTLVVEDDTAFWGATIYIGQNGMPTWWGGQTICP